jgi:hypothetical protein
MPLPHYGVVVGTLVQFTRDPQHNFGSWYHGHVTLDAGGAQWQSALDVDAPVAVGVAYRLVTGLTQADLGPVGSLSPGWTELTHTSASGALDYLRSPILQNGFLIRTLRRAFFRPRVPEGWRPPPPNIGMPGGPDPRDWEEPPFQPDPLDRVLQRLIRYPSLEAILTLLRLRWRSFPWIDSSGDNALDALEPHLNSASRIYLFGEHYEDGTNGVHDVHMNQGDPAGSQWYASNGTWQDGGVACESPDGNVVIWQVRFKTQSLHTDENGHPI